jgi:uncharacterized membrane protein YphA (DoxX/SURF4 family)
MPSDTQAAPVSKKMLWIGWILSILPALMLLAGGVMSLVKPSVAQEGLAHYGYPVSVALPLGIVELVCAALYLIPRTSVLGALLLTAYLGGATATHVRAGEPFYLAILVCVLVWAGLLLRESRLRPLLPLTR